MEHIDASHLKSTFFIPIFYLQISYYNSIIDWPVIAEGSNHAHRDKITRTLLYTITNRMFSKRLFAEEITWTGKSAFGDKFRFSHCDNIFKWYHDVLMQFDANISLEFVMDFFQKCICKPSKKRLNNTDSRRSTGRTQQKKKRGTVLTMKDSSENENVESQCATDKNYKLRETEGDDESENDES